MSDLFLDFSDNGADRLASAIVAALEEKGAASRQPVQKAQPFCSLIPTPKNLAANTALRHLVESRGRRFAFRRWT